MIITKPENQDTEFKQSWQDEYLKWICAFANTKGGIIYIGVHDKGEVLGLSNFHKLSEAIPLKIRQTMGLLVDVQGLTADDDESKKNTLMPLCCSRYLRGFWNTSASATVKTESAGIFSRSSVHCSSLSRYCLMVVSIPLPMGNES